MIIKLEIISRRKKTSRMIKWNKERIFYIIFVYLLPYRDFPLILKDPVTIRLFDAAILIYFYVGIVSLVFSDIDIKMNLQNLVVYSLYMVWICFVSIRGLQNSGYESLINRYLILVPYSFLFYSIAFNGTLRVE